jgi:hypothetical protein
LRPDAENDEWTTSPPRVPAQTGLGSNAQCYRSVRDITGTRYYHARTYRVHRVKLIMC